MFIKVRVAFAFGLQTLYLIHFTKIYQLMGRLKATQTFMNVVIDEKVYLTYIACQCKKTSA